VLYLAEVIQKKGGIMGGGKSELKLLACQRGEQNWQAISGDEAIASDEAARYGPGTLLLVDLTANRQVQRVQEAGRPLVGILQNFSRSQEKYKTQEEEIEQWKQSLTYQSQELNRRELELEARQEQAQQVEVDVEQLEQQRQEFEQTRQQVLQQQEELDRAKQELQGAWEQLQGQQNQLEERKSELMGASVLDAEKAQAIYHLLDQLANSECSPDPVFSQIDQARDVMNQQQSLVTQHWQSWEQQHQSAQQLQGEVGQQQGEIAQQWQHWFEAQEALTHAQAAVKAQQALLEAKQAQVEFVRSQIQQCEALKQQLQHALEGTSGPDSGVDLNVLQGMPIDQLQGITGDLKREFEQSSQFVKGQEEELEHKRKELDDLKSKIQQANEFDRMSLETELADEQESYNFLHQTLVGQQRSLQEKAAILRPHRVILARRTGTPDPELGESGVDLTPMLAQVEAQRQQQAEALQNLELQIEQVKQSMQQAQDHANAKAGEQESKRHELKQWEETLAGQRATAAELIGKVTVYQELLQPMQDGLTAMQQQMDAIAALMSQGQESTQAQKAAIDQMRQIVNDLTSKPEFAIA
jgi:chromosome segregation ATPase